MTCHMRFLICSEMSRTVSDFFNHVGAVVSLLYAKAWQSNASEWKREKAASE